MGAHFEALNEGILVVPLDPRYTQVEFNPIYVQVCGVNDLPIKDNVKLIIEFSCDSLIGLCVMGSCYRKKIYNCCKGPLLMNGYPSAIALSPRKATKQLEGLSINEVPYQFTE